MRTIAMTLLLAACGHAKYAEPRTRCDEYSCQHQAACEACLEACPSACRFYHPPDDTGVGVYECRNDAAGPFWPEQYGEGCDTGG